MCCFPLATVLSSKDCLGTCQNHSLFAEDPKIRTSAWIFIIKFLRTAKNKTLQYAMRNKDAFAGNGPADSVDLLFGPLGRVLRWFGSVWPRSGVFRITPVMTILVGTCTKVQAVKTSIMRKKGGDIMVVRKMVAGAIVDIAYAMIGILIPNLLFILSEGS